MITTKSTFTRMARDSEPSATAKKYTAGDYLKTMNDPVKKAAYSNLKIAIEHEGLTPRATFERKDWADFVPTIYLDPILENVSYQSTASQLANNISVDTGITFKYREFENFQRAQRMAENTELDRSKGSTALQEVPFHTLGLRSYVTEEEMMDLPFSSMQLELNTMGAALALERDLLWMDSLYRATSEDNATTYYNMLTSSAALDLEGLHAVLTWFTSPFAADLTTITLENPFEDSGKRPRKWKAA